LYGIENDRFSRCTAVAAPADRSGMGCAAVPAKNERSHAFMLVEVLVFAITDDPVEKNHPAPPWASSKGIQKDPSPSPHHRRAA